jgi:predicted GNAT superfamily acetyltransferase
VAIEYRELASEDDFRQCLDLQRRVYSYSEAELVSPLIYRMIARDDPPVGILIGAFVDGEEIPRLVGLALGFATFEASAVYGASLALLPEYQSGLCGYRMMMKFREVALARGGAKHIWRPRIPGDQPCTVVLRRYRFPLDQVQS